MPGRIGNSPGPQVLTTPDRPVPAVRRSSLLTNKSPLLPHQHQTSTDAADGYQWSQKSQQPMAPNGTNGQIHSESRRPSATGQSAQTQLFHGQPQRPVSTVRPQSALSASSPKAYERMLHDRPPSSLGGDWSSNPRFDRGPVYQTNDGRKTPINTPTANVFNSNKTPKGYMEQGNVTPVHERTRSFGDGISIAPPYNGSDLTEKVYGGVARQQNPTDAYDRRAQSRDQLPNGTYQSVIKSQQSSYSSSPKSPRGQDNPAFVADDKMSAPKSPGLQGHDLRNAWQRFYGVRTDIPAQGPNSGIEEVSSRKSQTMDGIQKHQNGFVPNGHQVTPYQALPHHAIPHQASPQPTRPMNPTNTVHTPQTTRVNTQQTSRPNTPSNARRPSSGSVVNRPNFSAPDPINRNDYSYGSTTSINQNSYMHDRESPTGQSSNYPEQISGNTNSSHAFPGTSRNLSTFKPEKDKSARSPETAIGPAARYPDMPMHSSVRKSPRLPGPPALAKAGNTLAPASPQAVAGLAAMKHRSFSSQSADTVEFKVEDSASRPLFTARTNRSVFLDSEDDLDNEEYMLASSDNAESEAEAGQRPPPVQSAHGSGRSTPANVSSRLTSGSPSLNEGHKTPDIMRQSHVNKATPAGTFPVRLDNMLVNHLVHHNGLSHDHSGPQIGKHLLTEYTRSRSLEDVRESGNESSISFDIENTVLTVEPSDQSEMGTLRSYKTGSSVKAQLNRLEDMYSRVMRTIEETNSRGPRTRRRWSIGSSDTSSLRQPTHHSRHNRSSNQKIGSRDVKAINKRFQRLESHVITLARSVAHLSSELRNQTTMSREIENVKREITELKLERQTTQGSNSGMRHHRGSHEHDKYRYWSPFFANPRRVGKLTRFFGQEPPLLELFLKKLGYEKYLKNFDNEQITMIELPYMTEDRLDKIGIPMGPRMRILQEAQLCVKKGDFDIYFV
ncbi:uncharacterized protein LOC106060380 isoform X1 [Biomphalaria glabrata]|uniref:Uncharacterized protein LOC106060380 isoform X1 n=1 Tax=Biomphalaria glabrata TaxID=6526 RepID=A0A2C9JMR6_BIOGL|nr:uncharacterized protein LOC106060380 isoform X1 [Biomphalaria glabrata]